MIALSKSIQPGDAGHLFTQHGRPLSTDCLKGAATTMRRVVMSSSKTLLHLHCIPAHTEPKELGGPARHILGVAVCPVLHNKLQDRHHT